MVRDAALPRVVLTALALLGASLVASPTDAAAPTADGWFAVVEQNAGLVSLVAPDGSRQTLADELGNPRGLAVSPGGDRMVVVEAGTDAGEGALTEISPDGPPRTILDGLTFPEGVTYLGEEELLFSLFTEQVVQRVGLDGAAPETVVQLDQNPTGIVPVPAGRPGAVLVSTWEGAGVVLDPNSGEFQPVTDQLQGGGHPDVSPDGSEVCIPEFGAGRVRCFPIDGSEPRTLDGFPDAIGVSFVDGQLAVAIGSEVVVVDADSGLEQLRIDTANSADTVAIEDPTAWGGQPAAPTEPDDETATPDEQATPSPEAQSPTPTAAPPPADDDTAPEGVPIRTFEGNLLPWILGLAGLLALAALGLLLARRARADAEHDGDGDGDGAGSVAPPPAASEPADTGRTVAVYPDPCADPCARAERAEAAAEAAADAAAEAQQRAEQTAETAERAQQQSDQAQQEATDARATADQAQQDLEEARKPPQHSGGYASSGDREYTGADHDRVGARRGAIMDAWRAGEMSADEAQEAFEELGEPETWDELREQEEQEHAEKVAAAERRAEEAEQRAREAEQRAEQAAQDAETARNEADQARGEADQARGDAEEAAERAEAARRACQECLKQHAIDSAGSTAVTAAGGGGSTQAPAIGDPCGDEEPRTVETSRQFSIPDPARPITVDVADRVADYITDEDVDVIRAGAEAMAEVLDAVSERVKGPVSLAVDYMAFVLEAGESALGAGQQIRDGITEDGRVRAGGDVRIVVPRLDLTVTCRCQMVCRNGVWVCSGCTVERSQPTPTQRVLQEQFVHSSELHRAIGRAQNIASSYQRQSEQMQEFIDGCSC